MRKELKFYDFSKEKTMNELINSVSVSIQDTD